MWQHMYVEHGTHTVIPCTAEPAVYSRSPNLWICGTKGMAAAAPAPELSEYEKLRESNIRRNADKLTDLGLANATESRAAALNKTRKRKRAPKAPPAQGSRRSSRHLGREPVNYKEVDVHMPKVCWLDLLVG